MIPVYLLTNNNHLWLIPGFVYLWNKYCDKQVTIVGYDKKPHLSLNFNFISLGNQLPASKWSDGLLKMLDIIGHKHFILMLEDFWLFQQTDIAKINKMGNLMNDDILRIDISGNRQSYKSAVEIKPGVYETFEGTPYQMSFQAAIWNKDNLKKVLKKGENPWQSEINGSNRVGNLRVLGCKAMWYRPVWRSKKQAFDLRSIRTEDLDYIKGQGWLNNP